MRVTRAQFLAVMRREVGDQQPAAGREHARRLGDCRAGLLREMQNVMKDRNVSPAVASFLRRTTMQSLLGLDQACGREHFTNAVYIEAERDTFQFQTGFKKLSEAAFDEGASRDRLVQARDRWKLFS